VLADWGGHGHFYHGRVSEVQTLVISPKKGAGRNRAGKTDAAKQEHELAYRIDYCDGDMEEEIDLSRVRLFDGDGDQWEAHSPMKQPVPAARGTHKPSTPTQKGGKKRGRVDEKFADFLDRNVLKEFNDVMYKGVVVSMRKFSGSMLFKVPFVSVNHGLLVLISSALLR
jgi:hypothetical protein